MENQNLVERLATIFSQNASVKSVFGEPIQAGEKTIIPVSQISYGVGGGWGNIEKHNPEKPISTLSEGLKKNENELNESNGGGGGGGIFIKSKGVFEITPKRTRFIPADNFKQVVMCVTFGFLLSKLLTRGSKKS
jgi:uncharacterized spore protein YtfJ